MSLVFTYGGVDLGTAAVRLGKIDGLPSAAEKCTIAQGGVPVDDPSGTLSLGPLETFTVDETACTPARLYTGFATARDTDRADSLILGAERRIDVTLLDLNAVFNFVIISGTDGNRPAETDIERITWMLGTSYAAGLADHGLIDTADPVDLEARDYQGLYIDTVLGDCANASNKNPFATYDDASGDVTLAYFDVTSTTFMSSTLRISNVLADQDDATTFGPESAKLNQDPSKIYQGVWMPYNGGTVYRENLISGIPFRSTAAPAVTVTTAAAANALADAFLARSADEMDRITCVVQLPLDKVNLIRAGQRIEVKFAHLVGYTSFTWVRVAHMSPAQIHETDQFYTCTLELHDTRLDGFIAGGSPTGITKIGRPSGV